MEDVKKKIQSLRTFRGKIMQPWMKRAADNPQIHTKANESVRSRVDESGGKQHLYPTIRLRAPGLEKISAKQALKEAIKRKDTITFKTPKEGTEYSKQFSNSLGKTNYVEKRK